MRVGRFCLLVALCAGLSQTALAGGGSVDENGNINLNFQFLFPPLQTDIDRVQEQAERASRMLCDATEGQFRIGSVLISGGPASEPAADVWYYPDGAIGRSSSHNGLTDPSGRIYLEYDSISAEVLAHEMGHLVFRLGDQYNEQRRKGGACGIGPSFDEGATDEQNHTLMQQQGRQRCVTPLGVVSPRPCYNDSECEPGETCPLAALSTEFSVEANADLLIGDNALGPDPNVCPENRAGSVVRVGGYLRAGNPVAGIDLSDFETAKATSPVEIARDYIDEIGLVEAYDEGSAHALWVFSEHTGTQTWRIHFAMDDKHFEGGVEGEIRPLQYCEIVFEAVPSFTASLPEGATLDHRRVESVNGVPVGGDPICEVFIDDFANGAGPAFLQVSFDELSERDSPDSGGSFGAQDFSLGTDVLAAGDVQQLGICTELPACARRWNEGTQRWEASAVTVERIKEGLEPQDEWTELVANVQTLYGITANAPDLPDANEPVSCAPDIDFDLDVSGVDQVMVVLDRSGSMSADRNLFGDTRTRLEWAQAGARGFATLQKGSGVEVGLVSFASTASADLDLGPITGDVEEEAFHDAVDDLSPNGDTAIGDALAAARDLFDAEADDRTQAILLLSDGENNEGAEPNSIAPSLVDRNIIVYSVPVGGAADGQETAVIADQTGGDSSDAETALELPTIFADLYAKLRGETPIKNRTPLSVGPANPANGSLGPPKDVEILVEGGGTRLNLMLSNANDVPGTWNPGFQLIDPGGVIVLDDLHPSVANDPFFKIGRVANPVAGKWTLRVFARLPFPQDMAYWVHLENPVPDCWAGVSPVIVTNPLEGFRIRATSSYGGPLGRGVEYEARITGHHGFEMTVPLTNDLEHGGAEAHVTTGLPGRGRYDVVVSCFAGSAARFDPGEGATPESVAEQGRPEPFVRAPRTSLFLDVPGYYVPPGDDCDGDGFTNSQEGGLSVDLDGDGVPNACDDDADGDDIPDDDDGPGDSDGDGAPNWLDADQDNDGTDDGADNCPLISNQGQVDVDGDGVGNACDNCTLVANPSQLDTDQDHFGNACDPDFDGNGLVGVSDFAVLRTQFGKRLSADRDFDPDVDSDGDGVIGVADFNALRRLFARPPGPSGLAGRTPAPTLVRRD